jgi:hypothetical protein
MSNESSNRSPDIDKDPTEDLTPVLAPDRVRPEDLEVGTARGYARGVLYVFRARRLLFGTVGLRGISIDKARAAALCLADVSPDDLPHHVRQKLLRLTYLGRFLQDSPNEADLRDFAEHLFGIATQLEEFLEDVFGD